MSPHFFFSLAVKKWAKKQGEIAGSINLEKPRWGYLILSRFQL